MRKANFNNFEAFVMFAVKKIGSLAYLGRKILNMLMLVRKNFFDYAYFSPENFFELPPSTTFSGKIRTTWSKSEEMLVKT